MVSRIALFTWVLGKIGLFLTTEPVAWLAAVVPRQPRPIELPE